MLYDEFFDYKYLFVGDIDNAEAELKRSEDDDGHAKFQYRMDVIWYLLQQITSPAGDSFRFKLLFSVATIVLVTPHSNAGIERVYSLVNKMSKGHCSLSSE